MGSFCCLKSWDLIFFFDVWMVRKRRKMKEIQNFKSRDLLFLGTQEDEKLRSQ
jgi:hypothetical protein